MTISAHLQKELTALREWAADEAVVMYIFTPAAKPRVIVYRDEVLSCLTDEALWTFLQQRFAESWAPPPT